MIKPIFFSIESVGYKWCTSQNKSQSMWPIWEISFNKTHHMICIFIKVEIEINYFPSAVFARKGSVFPSEYLHKLKTNKPTWNPPSNIVNHFCVTSLVYWLTLLINSRIFKHNSEKSSISLFLEADPHIFSLFNNVFSFRCPWWSSTTSQSSGSSWNTNTMWRGSVGTPSSKSPSQTLSRKTISSSVQPRFWRTTWKGLTVEMTMGLNFQVWHHFLELSFLITKSGMGVMLMGNISTVS